MREFTIMFHSVNEIAQFATIANRQPFPVHFNYKDSRLDAKSILSLCALRCRHPFPSNCRIARRTAPSFRTLRSSSVTRTHKQSDIAPFRFICLYK